MILSKRDEMNSLLQSKEIVNIEDIKFISFKNITIDNKAGALHLNKVNNMLVRFESLLEVNTKEKVIYNGEKNNLRITLMVIKYNYAQLFVGVE